MQVIRRKIQEEGPIGSVGVAAAHFCPCPLQSFGSYDKRCYLGSQIRNSPLQCKSPIRYHMPS
jgi:hypothetical protein